MMRRERELRTAMFAADIACRRTNSESDSARKRVGCCRDLGRRITGGGGGGKGGKGQVRAVDARRNGAPAPLALARVVKSHAEIFRTIFITSVFEDEILPVLVADSRVLGSTAEACALIFTSSRASQHKCIADSEGAEGRCRQKGTMQLSRHELCIITLLDP